MIGPLIATLLLAIAPARADTKHSFAVKVSGQGPSVILIPGLSCSGDVWDATVDHLKSRYTCHVLTLPGFGGVPPIPAPMLSTVRDEIEAYVTEKKLGRPILIGHSLGGMLALWLASDKPSMFAGVVSVDGVPYLGGLDDPKQTPAQAQQSIITIVTYFKSMDQQRFAGANALSLHAMITSQRDIDMVSIGANKSDPGSVGQAFSELLQNDLRPEMSKITIPLLLVVPDSNKKESDYGALKAKYELQVSSAAEHQIVIAPKSLHFVMLDAQSFFFEHLDEFLVLSTRHG